MAMGGAGMGNGANFAKRGFILSKLIGAMLRSLGALGVRDQPEFSLSSLARTALNAGFIINTLNGLRHGRMAKPNARPPGRTKCLVELGAGPHPRYCSIPGYTAP